MKINKTFAPLDVRRAALIEAETNGTLPALLCFWGHTPRAEHPGPWVLSQWWPAPFEVDGVRYPHAEAYMMAAKARLFGDHARAEQIIFAPSPAIAKNIGRLVEGFNDETWAAHRYRIVIEANVAKFSQDPALAAYLVGTGPKVLVEASPQDQVWGVGLGARDPAIQQPSQWRGLNLLGYALMETRDILMAW